MGNYASKDDYMEEQSHQIPARMSVPPQMQQQDQMNQQNMHQHMHLHDQQSSPHMQQQQHQHMIQGSVGEAPGMDTAVYSQHQQQQMAMSGQSIGQQSIIGGVVVGNPDVMAMGHQMGSDMGQHGTGQEAFIRQGNMATDDVAVNDDDIVPTVFKWENGGRNVYITGTFNNWERQIPMHRSGNEFSYVHNLTRGKHAYKFIVDDEWRFAPDQPTVADVEGRINNFIDVSEFSPYVGDDAFFEKCKDRKVSNSEFKDIIPDLDEYTKEPPSLPPHLRLIILNKLPPSADPMALPEPQHVSLNHLYCTAIKDGMMVLGATQRYRQKYVTIVFYSVMSS